MFTECCHVPGTLLGLEDTSVSKTDVGLPYIHPTARWCELMGVDS